MERQNRRKAEELFEAALGLSPEERDRLLSEDAGVDAEIRAMVLDLLEAHDRGEGLLDRGLPAPAASLLGDRVFATPPSEGLSSAEARVGPYRIVDEIGRGGMGVVYRAERSDGQFRQSVALKVIRGDGDPDLPARMVAERQILASLDHPNIARLLDGGLTRDGRPYLVMEYVGGLPIDTYCDRMRLGVRERLRLFLTVVRAVDHAHHNLVVHRDLKPSNILVTTEGRVKLLDFGIAKLLNPTLVGVEAPVTRTEHRIMTPEYASPEQLRGEPLTTASDVYALGVVLYRLLTGHWPYRHRGRSASAVLTSIMEEDPERPSSRVVRPGEATDTVDDAAPSDPEVMAGLRDTTPERLRRILRGDLDAIIMKALRKEVPRRYASAERLARDLEAYLEGRPVLAHRGSRWYVVQKMLRRHRVEAVAAAMVAVALVGGAGAAAWQAGVAGRERDRAERALRQSEEVTDFLMELFQAGDPRSGRAEVTARDLLGRGVARADELSDQPVVQARLLDVLGEMSLRLGRPGDAAPLLQRAVDLRRNALGPDHPDLATSLIHLAWIHRGERRMDVARGLVEEALSIRRRAFGAIHPEVADAVYELGYISLPAEQEALYREALSIYEASGGDPTRARRILQGLATNLRRQGRLEEALAMAEEAVRAAEEENGPDHPATAQALFHLADQVRDIREDYDEAEGLYRRGLALERRGSGDNSVRLARGLGGLALVHSRRGDHEEAERLLRQALELRSAATGPDHPEVGANLSEIADQVSLQGRHGEAETLAREALRVLEGVLGPDHEALAAGYATLGRTLARAGRLEDAVSAYERAFSIHSALGGDRNVPLAEQKRELGRILIGAGRHGRAEPVLLEALETLEGVYPPEHPNVVDSRRALHELYTAWGRPAEATAYTVPEGRFYPY